MLKEISFLLLFLLVFASASWAMDFSELYKSPELNLYAKKAKLLGDMVKESQISLKDASSSRLRILAMVDLMQDQRAYELALENLSKAVVRVLKESTDLSSPRVQYKMDYAARKVSFGLGLVEASRMAKLETQHQENQMVTITLYGVAMRSSREGIRNIEEGIEEYSSLLLP